MASLGEGDSNINIETTQETQSRSSPFLLDHINLAFTVIFFGCLIAFLLFRSNNTTQRSTYYPCNQSFHYYSLHLDLNIDSFTELHRDVKIWISGVRNTTRGASVVPLNYTVDTTGLRKKTTIAFDRSKINMASFNFDDNSKTSKTIAMTDVFLNSSYDQVKVHFILNADFYGFLGVNVIWSFNTAPKPSYVTFLQILLPATTLYLTVHFLLNYFHDGEHYTQINVGALGVVAVLASLPYNLILGPGGFSTYSQITFTAIMVAYFRYVVASQIQLEAEGTSKPNMKVNAPLIIFFVIYCFVDLVVAFSNGQNPQTLSNLVTCVNVAYAIISVVITVIAFLKAEVTHSRRLIFMTVLECLSLLIVFRDQDYDSIVSGTQIPLQRSLTFGASHVFMVSYLLILLQICKDYGYTEMNAQANDQIGLMPNKNSLVEDDLEEEDDPENLKDFE